MIVQVCDHDGLVGLQVCSARRRCLSWLRSPRGDDQNAPFHSMGHKAFSALRATNRATTVSNKQAIAGFHCVWLLGWIPDCNHDCRHPGMRHAAAHACKNCADPWTLTSTLTSDLLILAVRHKRPGPGRAGHRLVRRRALPFTALACALSEAACEACCESQPNAYA